MKSKWSKEGVSKQIVLGRWVGDSQAVFVLEGNNFVFQALVLMDMARQYFGFTAVLAAKLVTSAKRVNGKKND